MVALILTHQSLGESLVLLFFFLSSSSSSFGLLVLFTPFYLDQTFAKSFPNLSAWLSLAQLCFAFLFFCFTLFLSGILTPTWRVLVQSLLDMFIFNYLGDNWSKLESSIEKVTFTLNFCVIMKLLLEISESTLKIPKITKSQNILV